MSSRKELLKLAFVKTLPVLAGYMVLGFGFGLMAENSGYGVLWVLAMSGLIYAGSMQYVTIGLLTGGAGLLTAALTTLMVNARHLFYGITMIKPYEAAGRAKPYLVFGLTDETYSLVCTGQAPEGIDFHQYALYVTAMNHAYWITGSLLGALAGSLVTFDTTGVDFAMTALFITVFVEQWKSTDNHIPALVGLACSVLCLLLFGRDGFLIPSMAAISGILILSRSRTEAKEAA